MPFSRSSLSKHPLVLCYLLALLLLVALLVHEWRKDRPGFSLSHVSAKDVQGVITLSAYGENLHADIKGVLLNNLVNEKALVWRQLTEVPARLLDVNDGLALVSFSRNKVVSVDLREEHPMLLDSIEMPGSVGQIKIIDDIALVGMVKDRGIALIDLKDPQNLNIVTHSPLQGSVIDMAAEQNIIYYAGVSMDIGRIDLASENPVPEALVSLNSPWRISVQGKKMAIGTLKGKVNLFNISTEGLLNEVGVLDYHEQIVSGVAFTKEALVVALSDSSLRVLDLSTWPQLAQTALLQLPGQPLQLKRMPGQASIAASLIAGGMVLIDVSQLTAPIFAGHLKLAKTFRDFVLTTEDFFGTSNSGFEMFSLDEIEDGEYKTLSSDAMVEQNYYGLRSWNGHVYGYDNKNIAELSVKAPKQVNSSNRYMAFVGKGIVNIFEQDAYGHPQNVGSLVLEEGAKDASFREDYLYVIYPEGLRVFSGSRPGDMVAVNDLKLPGILKRLEILDSGYLLIATRHKGVLVVDVNNPEQPKQVARLDVPQHLQNIHIVQDILVDGQRAYVSHGAGGVHVVDVSSPSQPELLQIVDTPGNAKKMVLCDDLLLVADGKEGLFVVDVKDSNRALPIGSLPLPLRVQQMVAADDSLIVSSPKGGTMKLPLPQRLRNMSFVDKGEMRFDVTNVTKGQYVYLYDEQTSGKMALDVH